MKLNWPLALMAAAAVLIVVDPSLRASETDAQIEAAARDSYVFKTCLEYDTVKAISRNGVVTLTGTVAKASHKSLAQDTVEALPGVESVENVLYVTDRIPPKGSDAWICAKVKSALRFHRNVSYAGTSVSVNNGVVTLSGEASCAAERQLAGEYADDVEGVKNVNNEMTVVANATPPPERAGGKIDDASVTAQVKASLLSHRSTCAIKIKVQTADGVVTISGAARNAADKSLITRLAKDTDGVNSVINAMTIELAATAQ
jgi:hyperosmotically inducible protein